MRPLGALVLAGFSGYLALSQEILWVHALSFASGGRPQLFAHVVGAFLVGVAGGSLFVERRAGRSTDDTRSLLPAVFVVSGVMSYLALPLLGRLYTTFGESALFAGYLLVGGLAFFGGCAFPLICQLGVRAGQQAGAGVSRLYFANIVGSALGPLFTTFVLMDKLPMSELMRALSFAFVATGLVIAAVVHSPRVSSLWLVGAGAVFTVLALTAHVGLYAGLWERLLHKDVFSAGRVFTRLIETRGGVVALGSEQPPTIWGGGAYDGRMTVDPITDANGIRRAYMVAALHPNPERVLAIGLSGGSWARVVAAHSAVKSLDVVEINRAYLELIGDLVDRHNVAIHVDDGRRWLSRHPERRFDFILMNTTLHWRSYTSNLLSREFLELCKRHLSPGGVMYWNTTDSADAVYTAAMVFKHVVRYRSFVAASDSPFSMTPEERAANMARFVVDEGYANALRALAHLPLPDVGENVRRASDRTVISDDNMATEFRSGGRPLAVRAAAVRLWETVAGERRSESAAELASGIE